MKTVSSLPEKILSKNRLIYLDLLKVVALIVMIYDHTLKFLIPVDKTDLFKAEIALDKYAPLASALFLCIAGYNLASSYQRQTHFQTWFVKKLKYGLILIATSFFVAIITYSSHTNFFATGILQTIALSIFMGIGLLKISISNKWRPLSYFLLGLLVFLGSEFVLQHHWLLPIISAYSFPLLPFFSYFVLGLGLYYLQRNKTNLSSKIIIFALSSLLIGTLVTLDPFSLIWLAKGYWIPSLPLNLWLALALVVVFLGLPTLEKCLHTPFWKIVTLPGRITYEVYVGHIILLTLLAVFYQTNSNIEFWLLMLILITSLYFYCLIRVDYKKLLKMTKHQVYY